MTVGTVNAPALTTPDLAGQLKDVQTLDSGQLDLDAKREAATQAKADEQAMRGYAQVGDMHSPEGLDQALKDMQGRISTKKYMELAAHAQTVKQQAIQYQDHLTKLDVAQLAQEKEASASMADALSPMLDAPHSPDEFKAKQQQVLAQMSQLMRADGKTPRYSPQALKQVADMDSDALMQLARTSGHRKTVVDNLHKEQQTKTLAAQEAAAEQRASGDVEAWKGPAGETFERSQHGSVVMQIDPSTGQAKVIPALPPGSTRIDSKSGAAAKPAAAAGLAPEVSQFFAEAQIESGKPFPGIPAGTGAAATATRQQYMTSVYEAAKANGYSGAEMGDLNRQRDVLKKVQTDMEGKNANIEAGEKNLENVGNRVKKELEKLGGPDSPALRGIWMKTMGEWGGDPKFSGLKAAITDYTESAARAYSGQTGAGGTPVTYLHLAQQSMGTNPNLGQFTETTDMLKGLFDDRRAAFRSTIDDLKSQSQMKPKPGSAAAGGGGGTSTTRVPDLPPDEARAELKHAREVFRSATDPAQKAIIQEAITKLEAQVKEKPAAKKPRTKAELEAEYLK